jgi:hypothetical protein
MDRAVNQVRRDAGGRRAHIREMELPPQIASQGSKLGPMPLQGFGVAPADTHLLHIGRHGLLERSQGMMTSLVLPGGAARRAQEWFVQRLSLRGVPVSSQDHFFKEV